MITPEEARKAADDAFINFRTFAENGMDGYAADALRAWLQAELFAYWKATHNMNPDYY